MRLELTFSYWRETEGGADDALEMVDGHQRPQDGSDAESFSFTTFDQLWKQSRSNQIKSDTSLISWNVLVFKELNTRIIKVRAQK